MENQKPVAGRWASRTPNVWHVSLDDLTSPDALQRLYERCVRLRFCSASDAARLAVFAVAARALRVATTNPAGLFATLVRTGCWRYATIADEDVGRAWLNELRDQPQATRSSIRSHEIRVGEPVRAADVLQNVLRAATISRVSPLTELVQQLRSRSGRDAA